MIEHPYSIPTCLGHRRPCLGAKRAYVLYLKQIHGK